MVKDKFNEAWPTMLLSESDFCAALGGISERKFKQLRAAGIVPSPKELGPRIARWTLADVHAVVERLPRRESRPEPETLAEARRQRIERLKSRAPQERG